MAIEGRELAQEETWRHYMHDNLSLYFLVALILFLAVLMNVVERWWQHWQNRLATQTGIKMQSQEYSSQLVRHFLPSFEVPVYQFRGMLRKAESIDIDFQDLSLEVGEAPHRKCVVKGVTGSFVGGRISAIMGPSGAGKTSFMNVLCGKASYGRIGGRIQVQGRDVEMKELLEIVGFVPQDDIVFEDLTVREQIFFSARLRNHRRLSAKRIDYIVDDVLMIMQLEHIQSSIVGGVESRGISGGQRKRVNIGLELAAQPSVLFLDEPTSGLDSTSSLLVAASLHRMGTLGMSSIMVIHQPRYSLFTLIDDVLLLGKGGQTVYLGPARCVKAYFESLGFAMPEFENPSDWFMDVISGVVRNATVSNFQPAMLFDMWAKHDGLHTLPDYHPSAARSRTLGEVEAAGVLRDALEQEWDRIDTSGNDLLDQEELQELLATCSSVIPDIDVVRDLMCRMAGPEAETVTKSQFLVYLCSMGEEIAHDEALTPMPLGVSESLSESDFFDRSESHSSDDGSSSSSSESSTPPRGAANGNVFAASSSRAKWFSMTRVRTRTRSVEEGRSKRLSARASIRPKNSRRRVREIPGIFMQLWVMMLRRLVQWWRFARPRLTFLGALVFGAVCLSTLDRYLAPQPVWDATPFLYLHTALTLLLSIFSLHVFGHNQPLFWRERARGIKIFSYFLARVLINALDLILMTFVFTSTYYIIRQPMVPYWGWMTPFLFSAFGASGWGYLMSTLIAPNNGPFVMTLTVFVTCAILGNFTNLVTFLDGGVMNWIVNALSLTRWTVAMSFDNSIEILNPQPTDPKEAFELSLEKGVYLNRGWGSLGVWGTAALAMVIDGIVLHILAFISLRFSNLKKQV